MRRSSALPLVVLVTLLLAVGGARAAQPSSATLLATGDAASCTDETDERVAALLARTQGTIALLGDAVYDNGTAEEFERCFMPAWGRLLPRIRASLGNHEYANGASRAETARRVLRLPTPSWYSYDLGAWHVVVLDSNCPFVGGCSAGSRQWRWLRRDLAQQRGKRCVLAYWHHARFSSGDEHGAYTPIDPLWRLLAAARADVVLFAHDHHYERFAPIDGMRAFVVGTGGRGLRPMGEIDPRSVVRQSESFGALRLSLRHDGYSWQFLTASGPTYTDEGRGRCR